jgi:hypothetical protein
MENERHDRHGEPGRLTVAEVLELLNGFMDIVSNRSDLTKDEAKVLMDNVQPTLDHLKAIQGS